MAENQDPPEGWPACDGEQVRVMLLGTYHMDNPGLDVMNVDADDVLAPDRQDELVELSDSLSRWNPDRVAVERPYHRADDVNRLYDDYRSGERAYNREETIDPPQPFRDEMDTECRSEVVQIGYRLADILNHEQVYPIDCPAMTIENEEEKSLGERGFDPVEKIPVPLPDPQETIQTENQRLADSTITEFLHWKNREAQLAFNHKLMFGHYLRWGDGDNFGGPRRLSTWYDRNIKMVHNLWRAVEPDDERMLLVVGSGHVRVLRHLLTETPMFCPVSPLAYL